MPPSGYAILIGAGPTSGAGIARILSNPSHGNLAVALLARNADNLTNVCESVRKSSNGGIVHPFPTDTDPSNLSKTFQSIKTHPAFRDLKLKLSIYHIKHALKGPFLETSSSAFNDSLSTYVTGAFAFGQESLKVMYEQNGGETTLEDSPGKKGTIIFTGTLGALRTNEGFNAYGAGRSGVRMVAQGLGKEVSRKGVHVVHTIVNGAMRDVTAETSEEVRKGKWMSAENIGKTYLWLSQMSPDVWIDELDLRPAAEKF